MNLLTGNLLVASSIVDQPVYTRGVCLVVHHDESSVIGVMLNRPMLPSPEALVSLFQAVLGDEEASGDALKDVESPDSPQSANRIAAGPVLAPQSKSSGGQLHFGGPLSGPVVAIHQLRPVTFGLFLPRIYVAAQKQHLEDLVRGHAGDYRLIVGHVGWEPSRLQQEFDAGHWHLLPATADVVFRNDTEMWPRLIRRATGRSLANWIGTPDIAGAAELN